MEIIFTAMPYKDVPNHYGARLAFLPDETLLITTGDRHRTHKNINLIVVGGDVNPMMQGWSFAGPFISSIDKWK